MKITRQHHQAQVTRINQLLDLIENTAIKGELTNTQLEYINDLENKLTIFGDYTMDKCKILEQASNLLLGKFENTAV